MVLQKGWRCYRTKFEDGIERKERLNKMFVAYAKICISYNKYIRRHIGKFKKEPKLDALMLNKIRFAFTFMANNVNKKRILV